MWDDPYEFEDDLDDMEQYERDCLREDARLEREEAEEAEESAVGSDDDDEIEI